MEIVLGLVLGLLAGIGVGYLIRRTMAERQVASAENRARTILEDARRASEAAKREALVEAKDEIYRMRADAEGELKQRRAESDRKEQRLEQREVALDQRVTSLDRKEQVAETRLAEIAEASGELERLAAAAHVELERVAGMTALDAKQALVEQIEDAAKRDAMLIVRDLESQAREEADKRARKIVSIAMQRVASELTTESTVTTVTLPSEDMKGRIIGREGRNIRAFESATGTNLIIDDT
nr:DUF3552 domain-containing protein [Actinomycetota bacterium]